MFSTSCKNQANGHLVVLQRKAFMYIEQRSGHSNRQLGDPKPGIHKATMPMAQVPAKSCQGCSALRSRPVSFHGSQSVPSILYKVGQSSAAHWHPSESTMAFAIATPRREAPHLVGVLHVGQCFVCLV